MEFVAIVASVSDTVLCGRGIQTMAHCHFKVPEPPQPPSRKLPRNGSQSGHGYINTYWVILWTVINFLEAWHPSEY